MTKHKHCEAITAWANGEPVQWFDTQTGEWVDCDKLTPPDWNSNVTYRIKVVPSERSYPLSSLTDAELMEFFVDGGDVLSAHRAVANEAVKRYIQDIEEGDV